MRRQGRHAGHEPSEAVALEVEILERIKSLRRLPYVRRLEDREDGVQNLVLQLLEAAAASGKDLALLLAEQPDLVQRKRETQRSRVRRGNKKLGRLMSEEMAACLPAQLVLRENEGAELLDRLSRQARLSALESAVVNLGVLGGVSSDELCDRFGITKEQLYRVRHRAMTKLRNLPQAAESLLRDHAHAHPAQATEGGRRVWKKVTSRVL
jgi:hypothetical protein